MIEEWQGKSHGLTTNLVMFGDERLGDNEV